MVLSMFKPDIISLKRILCDRCSSNWEVDIFDFAVDLEIFAYLNFRDYLIFGLFTKFRIHFSLVSLLE